MREIKFRAWNKLTNEFIDNFESKYLIEMLNMELHYITQFTGIQDKNGVDIYEGDILKSGKKIFPVVFEKGAFRTPYISKFRFISNNLLSGCVDCKIIGNIHEHPNLLK